MFCINAAWNIACKLLMGGQNCSREQNNANVSLKSGRKRFSEKYSNITPTPCVHSEMVYSCNVNTSDEVLCYHFSGFIALLY